MSHQYTTSTAPFVKLARQRLAVLFFVVVSFAALAGIGYWGYVFLVSDSITIRLVNQNNTVDTISYRTDAQTVSQALKEAGVYVEDADQITPPLDTNVEENMEIEVRKASQIILDIDGDLQRIYTHLSNPIAILSENNITLNTGDQLFIDNRPVEWQIAASLPAFPQHIRVVSAKEVIISDAGETSRRFQSATATTVGDALQEAGISLYLADIVRPSIDSPVKDGLTISIQRSSPVMIEADGVDLTTRAVGDTVSDVLNMLGLYLVGDDYTIPDENTHFQGQMSIQVVRVVERIEVEREAIAFDTIEITDSQLEANDRHIIQEGRDGIEEVRYRVRQENKLTVSRELVSRWIVQEPVPEIIAVGASE